MTHILAAIDAQTVTLPAESTRGEIITNLTGDLERIHTRHCQLMTQIEEAFLRQPLGQVLNSLPGSTRGPRFVFLGCSPGALRAVWGETRRGG